MQVDSGASLAQQEVRRSELHCLTGKAVGMLKKDFRSDAPLVRSWLEVCLSDQELHDLSVEVLATGCKAVVLPSSASMHGAAGDAKGNDTTGGRTVELRPEHLELHSSEGSLSWLKLGSGWLACSGAPGSKAPNTPQQWRREGASTVVNLLKDEEDLKRAARQRCEENGLRVEHVPLTGRKAILAPRCQQDIDSWRRLRTLVPELLRSGQHVVLHCSAGMHRTGSAAYLAVRQFGLRPADALRAVELMRLHTGAALLEPAAQISGEQPLWEFVEACVHTDPFLCEEVGAADENEDD